MKKKRIKKAHNFTLDPDSDRMLSELAAWRGMSRSHVVRASIKIEFEKEASVERARSEKRSNRS